MPSHAKTGFNKFFNEQMTAPSFATVYAQSRAQVDAVDELVRRLDETRLDLGMAKPNWRVLYRRSLKSYGGYAPLEAIRRLPMDQRQQLINRAAIEVEEDTPKAASVDTSLAHSLVGLMVDEPELVDQMCSLAYQARNAARMRTVDE